jgi:hypothetical protein
VLGPVRVIDGATSATVTVGPAVVKVPSSLVTLMLVAKIPLEA